MDKPVNLNRYRKQQRQGKARGATLCRSGFHKWEFDGRKQFDVKQGKLVSVQRCSRCGCQRNHVQ